MPIELAARPVAETKELSYAEAIREALAQAMEAGPRVFLFGEDVGVYGGAFGVSGDLLKRFGPERVIDTPISELGLAGAAVGAALTGMRPVLEIQFSDFITLAMEQIVNQAAKIRFMFGGKASVPMVVRLPGGSGTGAAAQHSQSLEAWFAHVPGLKVVQPSTPHDAKEIGRASCKGKSVDLGGRRIIKKKKKESVMSILEQLNPTWTQSHTLRRKLTSAQAPLKHCYKLRHALPVSHRHNRLSVRMFTHDV